MAKTNTKTKTPQEIAEEQVAAEEAARRESRIAEIAAEEEVKQEAERAEREAAEARKKAATEAHNLAEKRKPIEDRIAAKIAEIAPDLEELIALHDEHRKTLRESLDPEYNVSVRDGIRFTPTPDWARSNHDVRDTIRPYLEGSLSALYRKAKAPTGTLAELDPLTPLDSEDQAGRPAGDYPWERLEEEKRKVAESRDAEQEQRRAHDARRKLEALTERHKRVRSGYGRPVGFSELVMPEERRELYNLCTEEEIEEFKAEIEEGPGAA